MGPAQEANRISEILLLLPDFYIPRDNLAAKPTRTSTPPPTAFRMGPKAAPKAAPKGSYDYPPFPWYSPTHSPSPRAAPGQRGYCFADCRGPLTGRPPLRMRPSGSQLDLSCASPSFCQARDTAWGLRDVARGVGAEGDSSSFSPKSICRTVGHAASSHVTRVVRFLRAHLLGLCSGCCQMSVVGRAICVGRIVSVPQSR